MSEAACGPQPCGLQLLRRATTWLCTRGSSAGAMSSFLCSRDTGPTSAAPAHADSARMACGGCLATFGTSAVLPKSYDSRRRGVRFGQRTSSTVTLSVRHRTGHRVVRLEAADWLVATEIAESAKLLSSSCARPRRPVTTSSKSSSIPGVWWQHARVPGSTLVFSIASPRLYCPEPGSLVRVAVACSAFHDGWGPRVQHARPLQ